MKNIFNLTSALLLVLFTVIIFSCVPRKSVVYLQDENENQVVVNNQVYKELSHYVTEYRIREGDILSIRVLALNHDEYNFLDRNGLGISQRNGGVATSNEQTGFVVDDSGNVELPVVGNINVVNQTIEEAEKTIKMVMTEFVIAPTVMIYSMSYNFTILGEVRTPGIQNSTNRRINIFQAIALSNDLTEFADRSKIKLLRYTSKGQLEVYYLNLLNQEILQSEAFQIMPNDMIIVPPMASKNFRRNIIPLTGFVLSTFGAIYILLTRLKII